MLLPSRRPAASMKTVKSTASLSTIVNSVDRLSKATFLALSHRAPTLSAWFFAPIIWKAGGRLAVRSTYCDIRHARKAVRLAHRHQIYLKDVARDFDYYFSAV